MFHLVKGYFSRSVDYVDLYKKDDDILGDSFNQWLSNYTVEKLKSDRIKNREIIKAALSDLLTIPFKFLGDDQIEEIGSRLKEIAKISEYFKSSIQDRLRKQNNPVCFRWYDRVITAMPSNI